MVSVTQVQTDVRAVDRAELEKSGYKVADEGGNTGQLTQEDFFSLLTKELAHQDPTKPVENSEMISQMTAFSTTNGVAELNEKFSKFALGMSSSQALQASSLVGRSVLVKENVFGMAEGDEVKGKLVTDEPASNVRVYVENIAGDIIQTVPMGNIEAGKFAFSWDGQTSEGEQAPEGSYRFRIAGTVDGKGTELEAMTFRKVESVTLAGSGGNVTLNLNGGFAMALEDVIEVTDG
jgi:flagellar basal-body rod modification protein FlgD